MNFDLYVEKTVLPRSPTMRRQTAGAWESCWMLQSWLPHNLTMSFVGCDTKLSQSYPFLFLCFPFLRGWSGPCHSPERFLAHCGRMTWVTGFYSSSITAFSPPLRSLNHFLLSHSPSYFLTFFLWFHLSATERWPCRACLHSSSHSSFITASTVPACLTWWRRMVSITCNKRDGAWIRPHMEPGRCRFPAGPLSHPMNSEPFGPNSALPLIASLAGTASEWAQWACCRTEYILQAVKQSVIRRGNHEARTSAARELWLWIVFNVYFLFKCSFRGTSIQKYKLLVM